MTSAELTVYCEDCGLAFAIRSADPQRRCPACRSSAGPASGPRRAPVPRSRRGVGPIGTRTLFPAVCAACGRETRLPFKPRGDRPPYCPECFGRRR